MTRQATKVQGVDMAKVDMKCVDDALTRNALPLGGTDAQKVARLAQHYRTVDKKRIADCSTCGGISDVAEPACPYCGDGAVEGPATMHPDQKLTPPPPPPTALVRASQPAVVIPRVWTETDLNEAVRKVQELKLAAAERLWELGAAVKYIFDNELWKQRTADGVPRYKTWGQFTETELDITHSYSFKLMDVAGYFTRDEVRQFGASKLAITMQVPKGELQARMLKAAQDGASTRELKQLAEGLGKEKRDTGRKEKGGAGTHKPGSKKGGRKPEKITVAMLCTRVEVPLFKGAATDKRAKSLNDMPTGEERMFNGVKQRFVVTKEKDGNLVLVVERVRE